MPVGEVVPKAQRARFARLGRQVLPARSLVGDVVNV